MFINRRGFTLAEVLASLLALGVIVLAAQSLIMMANRFLYQSQETLVSMKDSSFMNNYICSKFTNPITVQKNSTRSYFYNSSSNQYEQVSSTNNEPATLSYPLLKYSQGAPGGSSYTTPILSSPNVTHSAVTSFLNSTGFTGQLKAHLNDKFGGSVSRNFKSQYYDIYADSHTLITFMAHVDKPSSLPTAVDMNKLGTITESDGKGMIIATRCIKNSTSQGSHGEYLNQYNYKLGSIVDSSDLPSTEQPVENALYILEGLKHRPFYFPSNTEGKNKIKCCDIDSSSTTFTASNTTDCKSLESYTPITYIIKFASEGGQLGTDASNTIRGYQKSLEAFLSATHNTTYTAKITACNALTGTTNQNNCKDKVHDSMAALHYFPKLREKIKFPVTFSQVTELPLNKTKEQMNWAYTFVAPSFSQTSHNSIQLSLLDIENGCLKTSFKSHCFDAGDVNKRVDLVQSALIQKKSCPFEYANLTTGQNLIHLGSHFEN